MATPQEPELVTSSSLNSLPQYDLEKMACTKRGESISKGGVACPFPWRLHECLDAMPKEGFEDIVSWQAHGRSFAVRKPEQFVELIMPRFFNQTKYGSFQRQLNIYGFSRLSCGKDKGTYYHYSFVRGHRSLVRDMVRCKIKGCKKPDGGRIRRERPTEQPNFYHPAWKNHFDHYIPPGAGIRLRGGQGKRRSVSPSTNESVPVSPSSASNQHAVSKTTQGDDDLPLLETSSVIEITPDSVDISISSYDDQDDDGSVLSEWEAEIPTDDLCQVGSLALFRAEPCLSSLDLDTSPVPLQTVSFLHPMVSSIHPMVSSSSLAGVPYPF